MLEVLQVRASCLRDDTMGRSVRLHSHAAGGIAKEGLDKRDLPVYEVETVNGVQKHEVRVDAASGQVLSSQLDL